MTAAVARMKRSEIRGRYQDSRIVLRYIRATNFAQIHVVPALSGNPWPPMLMLRRAAVPNAFHN